MLIWLCLACVPEVFRAWVSEKQNQPELPEYVPVIAAIEGITSNGSVRAEVYLRPVHPTVDDFLDLDIEVYANETIEVQMPDFPDTIGGLEVVSRSGGAGGGSSGHTVSIRSCQLRAPRSGKYTIPSMLIKYTERQAEEKIPAKSFETSEISVIVSSQTD